MKNAPREAEPEEAKMKDPRGPSAQDSDIYKLIVGTSKRARGRLTMRLLVMSQKNKNLLSQKNFSRDWLS